MNCKHKFRPRYNRKWSTLMNDIVTKGISVDHMKGYPGEPYLKEETYIYDICMKCGTTVGENEK